jgi:hypothetical protein
MAHIEGLAPAQAESVSAVTRDENNWGYQVKLFGPRRTTTTVAQVRAAGMSAVAQMSSEGVPRDLLTGRAF